MDRIRAQVPLLVPDVEVVGHPDRAIAAFGDVLLPLRRW